MFDIPVGWSATPMAGGEGEFALHSNKSTRQGLRFLEMAELDKLRVVIVGRCSTPKRLNLSRAVFETQLAAARMHGLRAREFG